MAGAAFAPWRRGRRVESLTLKPCAARISAERCFALAGRWAWIFALLVPLQLAGFAWLWEDSDSQVNRQIHQGERNVAALRSRINASHPWRASPRAREPYKLAGGQPRTRYRQDRSLMDSVAD